MNDRLREVIQLIRRALEDDPAGIVIGDLRPPNRSINVSQSPISDYYEFLAECDGARCGVVDLWSYDELPENCFRLVHLGDEASRWLCVGQLLYDPLGINKGSGEIRQFRQGTPPDFQGRCLGTAMDFIERDAFGPGYLRLVPDPDTDPWCTLLRRLGLLNGP